MSNISQQLAAWALTNSKLSLTPEMIEKLGMFVVQARSAEKAVDAFTFTYDVGGTSVGGFLVIPKKRQGNLPAIVFNRGGTGDFGRISEWALYTRIAAMAQWGYAIIGSQYPGNSYSDGKDERGGKSDIASVLRLHELIKHLSDVDETHIGMYGESRGGMMTYLCMKEVGLKLR
jgi:dipeptidyl aminopeptidase/acylaminoacyl peptidase